MPSLTDVTLETVARGAAPEVFAHEFAKVLKNIQDPNTDPGEVRSISLTFKFKPLTSREEAQVRLEVKSKLAAMAPVGGHMFMGRQDGKLRATTHDTSQDDLFDRETGEVIPIDTAQDRA